MITKFAVFLWSLSSQDKKYIAIMLLSAFVIGGMVGGALVA